MIKQGLSDRNLDARVIVRGILLKSKCWMPPVLMISRYQNNVWVKAHNYCSDTVVSIMTVDAIVTDFVAHRP